MVVCNLVEGDHAPSSDIAAHAYVYRQLPEVNGVVLVHKAGQLGDPVPIAQHHIDALFDRYQNVYGQPDQGHRA